MEWVSLREAAKRLDVDPQTVRRRRERGELEGEKIKGKYGEEWRILLPETTGGTTGQVAAWEPSPEWTPTISLPREEPYRATLRESPSARRLIPRSALLVLLLAIAPLLPGMLLPAPVWYPTQPIEVAERVVHPGDLLTFPNTTRCNWLPIDVPFLFRGQIESLNGTLRVPFAGSSLIATPGCHATTSQVKLLPSDLPPGRYRITGVMIESTSWRNYTVPYASTPFEVVDGNSPQR